MNKKGDIWISTVIYIGLSIVAISLLVGAGVPLINKMRDRNTFFQTKEVMQTIDKAIVEVVSEGPGSRRFLSPLEIKKGSLSIILSPRKIIWEMETKAKLQETNQEISDGNLKTKIIEDDLIKDLYNVEMYLDHFNDDNICICVDDGVNVDCVSGSAENLRGRFSLSITNEGTNVDCPSNSIEVNIKVL